MSKPYSLDLRERVVASIEAGASRHEAAEDRLRMWPVSRRVNRTGGGDDPALIAEIAA